MLLKWRRVTNKSVIVGDSKMDNKHTKSEASAQVVAQASGASTSTFGSKMHKALALCVGVLLSLQAYSLFPQTRLLVIAISVFAIIFVFMLLFGLVRLARSAGRSGIQPVKQDTLSDLGA